MRHILNILILLLCVMRSLLPPGTMLASTNNASGVSIVICSGHGPLLVTDDELGLNSESAKTQPTKRLPSGQGDECPFARAHIAALPAADVHVLETTAEYAALEFRIASEQFRVTPKPSARSARGPPTVSV